MSSVNSLSSLIANAYRASSAASKSTAASTDASSTGVSGGASAAGTDSLSLSPESIKALEASLAAQALAGSSNGLFGSDTDSTSGDSLAALLGSDSASSEQDPFATTSTQDPLLAALTGKSEQDDSDPLGDLLKQYLSTMEQHNAELIQQAEKRFNLPTTGASGDDAGASGVWSPA